LHPLLTSLLIDVFEVWDEDKKFWKVRLSFSNSKVSFHWIQWDIKVGLDF
jgi:hypothetical protein